MSSGELRESPASPHAMARHYIAHSHEGLVWRFGPRILRSCCVVLFLPCPRFLLISELRESPLERRYIPHSHTGGAVRGMVVDARSRAPHKTRSVTPRPLRRAQGKLRATRARIFCDFFRVILWISGRGQFVILGKTSDQ